MPQCVSDYCDYPMDPAWHFCPNCGTDNRPPARRGKVPHHYHRFVARSGFCWLCGEPSDEPYAFNRKWRLRLSATAATVGAGFLGWAGMLYTMHASPRGALGQWVTSWYEIEVTHRRRGGRYYTTWAGSDAVQWSVIVGVLLLLVGLALFFRTPFERGDDGIGGTGYCN